MPADYLHNHRAYCTPRLGYHFINGTSILRLRGRGVVL
jgi:hypothetical protein